MYLAAHAWKFIVYDGRRKFLTDFQGSCVPWCLLTSSAMAVSIILTIWPSTKQACISCEICLVVVWPSLNIILHIAAYILPRHCNSKNLNTSEKVLPVRFVNVGYFLYLNNLHIYLDFYLIYPEGLYYFYSKIFKSCNYGFFLNLITGIIINQLNKLILFELYWKKKTTISNGKVYICMYVCTWIKILWQYEKKKKKLHPKVKNQVIEISIWLYFLYLNDLYIY